METASLRLKFTPIIKDIQRNESKCCLEIVPEVSCVQNLDKIEWKQNCDFLEYTIPMTYKIILKKKTSEIMDTTNWDNTYHSCVDLLPPSSLTNIYYASGDIQRILSDTFILSRIPSYYEEDNGTKYIHQQTTKEINDQDKIVIVNEEKDDTRLFINTVIAPSVPLGNIEECLEESNPDSKNDEFSNGDTLQETPPEYDTYKKPSYKDIAIEITQSLDEISLETLKSKENSKRQLTVTPVCSINTNDEPFEDTIDVFSLNSVICRMFGSESLRRSNYVADRQEHITNENFACKPLALEMAESVKNLSVTKSLYTTNREGAKARVAEFVKKMEAEVLPLKLMLNDLLEKCATLGLIKNKLLTSIEFDQANTSRLVEKQSKSNRVVYTIVFDG